MSTGSQSSPGSSSDAQRAHLEVDEEEANVVREVFRVVRIETVIPTSVGAEGTLRGVN
ncbi:MAG: hypothetical protein HY686_06145 [Chloroflexi bacterium]|nr:hypothetical protein [Chloroflexota bacterium]